jgi:hypothetical protein
MLSPKKKRSKDRVQEKTQPIGQISFKDDGRFAFVIGALYVVLLAMVVSHHEMWRDEMQIWMIARQSDTVADLFRNLKYEPHPALWYILAFLTSKISSSPATLQILHVIIASTTAYVFLRFAPLCRLHKGLFIFGFFPFYEYGVIARCYSLGILLAFLFCALFRYRDKNLLTMSVILFLLANCSAYGLFMAFSLELTLAASWFMDSRLNNPWKSPMWKMIAAVAIIVAGLVISALQIAPPADGVRFKQTCTYYDPLLFQAVISTVSVAYVYGFGFFGDIYGPVFSVLLLIFSVLTFFRRPVPLFTYITTILIMLGASYLKMLGFIWHIGHLFIVYILCLWLGSYDEPGPAKKPFVSKVSINFGRLTYMYLTVLLVLQLFPSIYATKEDLAKPFSNGKAVAAFLKNKGLENVMIAGDIDFVASTVSGYLNKSIYYLSSKRYGTFIIWDRYRSDSIASPDVFAEGIHKLKEESSSKILLALSYEITPTWQDYLGAKPLQSFTDSVAGFIQSGPVSEDFWLYLIEK